MQHEKIVNRIDSAFGIIPWLFIIALAVVLGIVVRSNIAESQVPVETTPPCLTMDQVLDDAVELFSDETVSKITDAYYHSAVSMFPNPQNINWWYVEFIVDTQGRTVGMSYVYQDGAWTCYDWGASHP